MAWLQSSFTNHHLMEEGKGNNFRKGYKVGSSLKDTDPDKSDTPLLHEAPRLMCPDHSVLDSNRFGSPNVKEPKKNITSRFFSSGFFDRSGCNLKLKNTSNGPNSPENTANKAKEDKKLLDLKKTEEDKFEIGQDNYEEEESDDEWCIPCGASTGYQRIKSGTD